MVRGKVATQTEVGQNYSTRPLVQDHVTQLQISVDYVALEKSFKSHKNQKTFWLMATIASRSCLELQEELESWSQDCGIRIMFPRVKLTMLHSA